MGRIVTFELCLSDTAVRVVNEYKVDVVRVASEAVFECLRAKIESEQALKLKDNEQLREQLRIMEGLLLEVHSAELARAMCKV
jgi:mevalonate kinase